MQMIGESIKVYFDSITSIPEENAVRLYRNKSDLKYIPPIKVDANMLSDFGKEVLCK